MRILFEKYPIGIVVCILWSIFLVPATLFDINNLIIIILGLPFILFIPGYIMMFVLFPSKKNEGGIDNLERMALSFGLSIAVVPLIGLALNYTPWGIRLEPILLMLFSLIIAGGIIGIYRWLRLAPNKRFVISIDLSIPKHGNFSDKIVTILLAASLIATIIIIIFIISFPIPGEKFSELYLLDEYGGTNDYPKNLTLGKNASVVIGIVNHEYRKVNYTVEIWLVNQTFINNDSTNESEILYNHMWFMGKIPVALNYNSINYQETWKPQWEYNFSFNISKEGNFKLVFLLYKTFTTDYMFNVDYKELALYKVDEEFGNADLKTHLWVNVK